MNEDKISNIDEENQNSMDKTTFIPPSPLYTPNHFHLQKNNDNFTIKASYYR